MHAYHAKVCLLGDFAVGKTSLVRRFVYNLFDDKYISTIGVKVSRKTVVVPHGEDVAEVTLLLWDLAGSEEFDRLRASYLRGAKGAVLVCDPTRIETCQRLWQYARDLFAVNADARVVLAANKHDLRGSQPDGHWVEALSLVEAVSLELNAPYYLTSAMTGQAVQPMCRQLGQLVVGSIPGNPG